MKRILLVVLIGVILLSFTLNIFAMENWRVKDKNVQDFIRSVTVQIKIGVERFERYVSWFKYEEGYKLTDKAYDRLSDDEKLWYDMGYRVEYGDWTPFDEGIQGWICGSGYIVYSQQFSEALMRIKGFQGETDIQTNAHVIQFLTKYADECGGTRSEYRNIYRDEDMVINTFPISVKIKPNVRPYKQAYWKATDSYAIILSKEDQQYEIKAKVIGFDMGLDVAILQLKDVWGLPYALYRETQVQVGEEVLQCGAPLAIKFSLDKGRVNQINLDLGRGDGEHPIIWDNQIKIDIPGAPGSSGSGVFDMEGYIVAEHHGVLVYNGNYIEGGHLAIDGMAIIDWLIWNGFAYIALQDEIWEGQPKLVHIMD